ncbi:MAG: B12-binding domain-containing radical SAM protein [Gemmatimonadota bacterium]
MNALLLSPKFPITFWGFQHALSFVRKRAALPPLGLLTVASLLPHTWEKRLVDLNVEDLTPEDLEWADYAFLGGMAVQRKSALDLVARCRAAGVPVVAGGPLFTSDPGDVPEVEHLLLNEAELTLPRFLSDLAKGTPARLYEASGFADLTESPVPMWSLARLDRYQSMSVQYSRGCPYDCEFCNVTALFGHRPRIKPAEQVVGELDALLAEGWRGPVFFADDNIIGHRKSVKTELLPALIRWQRLRGPIRFYTQASVNLADDDGLLEMMVAAGFESVFVGIETPDERGLMESNKKHNLNRDLIGDVKRIHRAGIQVQGGFIVGFDSDDASIFDRQIRFIQESGIVTAMVGLLQAPPGTRLFERLKREGRLLGRITGDNSDGTSNILPLMDGRTLCQGYRRILEHIYAPQHFYERVRTFLREYRQPPLRKAGGQPRLLPFLRSIYRLGIRGEERVQYWFLLFSTLFSRPRLLPTAVTLAIYGHHFRRVSESLLGEAAVASAMPTDR